MFLDVLKMAPDEQKCVAIVGAGRVGSWIAVLLAQLGISRFRLIDFDTVTLDNLKIKNMVPYTSADIGEYKVNALKKQMKAINSNIQINCFVQQLSDQMTILEINKILGDSVLIVWAIDTRDGLALLQVPDIMFLKPGVVTAVHADFGGGHVVIWEPFKTPCPQHTLGVASFANIQETRASFTKITAVDVIKTAQYTTQVIGRLILRKNLISWNSLNIDKGNLLHIVKMNDHVYRKMWYKPARDPNCALCKGHLN
jgi:molybdopterin/thiamine biosynthesis adenylyltransferase